MPNGSRVKKSWLKFSSKFIWKKNGSPATDGNVSNASAGKLVDATSHEVHDAVSLAEIDTNVIAQAKFDAHKALDSQRNLGGRTQNMLENGEPMVGTVDSVSDLFQPLLAKVQGFVKLVDVLADIHPYAKIASTVLLAGVRVMTSQAQRDRTMVELLDVMDDLYEFVNTAKDLDDVKRNRMNLLKDMSLQTIQCAYFIRDQAQVKNFILRAGSNALSGSQLDGKITEFIDAFRDLRRRFTEHGMLAGEMRLVKLIDIGSDIQETIDLQSLVCIRQAGLDSGKGCLPGTRVKTLEELSSWVNDTGSPPVMFLFGGAGTGKSSIAHAIGGRFQALDRLGSFVRFDRSSQQDYQLRNVVRTIARNLADWDPVFRRVLAKAIHDKRDLVETTDMSRQWSELIVAPLSKVAFVGPVLVVIDAFDECGPVDASERRLLLKLLTERAAQLPLNFRVLVTSRPEQDVLLSLRLSEDQYVNHRDLKEYEEEARTDIALYVQHELAPKDPEFDQALDDEDLQLLADKAEGLFQWAATACRAIREQLNGMTLKEGLTWCLKLMSQGGPASLDQLYRGILQGLFKSENATAMERFRMVMAQVLCSSSPLSIEVLEEIHCLANGAQKGEVNLIVRAMGSLLSGVQTRTSPVRPHHTSFRDFLIDESRSQEWSVNLATIGHPAMARGCLRVMNARLTINICHLETSSAFNRDVADLGDRISKAIPPSLSYAACHWQDHLPNVTLTSDLVAEFDRFLQENLLFWLELLSLLEALNRAAPALEAALAIYPDATGGPCRELLGDAILFIRHFAILIALSAAHVYLSALALSPKSSEVRSTYLPRFPNLPVVDGVADFWPQTRAVLLGHTDLVYSVAYSLDSRSIASGASDYTVRIWDVETGATLNTWKCNSWVEGVAFSPDSHHIAACSNNTVYEWDCVTGDGVCELTHEARVQCFAYSQDGHRIVSGDADGRICIWSMVTHTAIHQLTHGDQPVYSVAFSASGRYLASGGEDGMVRVWNANDGQLVGVPLEGHTTWICSVLFSRDDRWIISGSHDATIRIWNVATQQTLHIISHLGLVLSLSLSPDGTCIVSGSSNGQTLIWDLATQQMVGEPYVGHSEMVNAVSFSPDGRYIVSGSSDTTVRIWSAENTVIKKSYGGAFPSATSHFSCFACSPDGGSIISGNRDGSIHVWDANTGQLIREPLQAHSKRITCVRFSPAGTCFATASFDETLCVWDWATLQPLGEPLRGHTGSVLDVDFSPDGRRIVSSSADETLRIWDVDTFQCLFGPLAGHTDWVTSVAWSPDGTRIASSDQSLCIWDSHSGSAVAEPFMGHNGGVNSISWSTDSLYLMTSSDDGTVRIWDAQTRLPVSEPLNCYQGWVHCSRYSPDGLRIVSGGGDGSIRMWNAHSRKPIGISRTYTSGAIVNLAFSPDGRRLISLTSSGSIIICDADAFTGTHSSSRNLPDLDASLTYPKGVSEPAWDGWIRDAEGNMVMWVPDEYRDTILWQGMDMIIGRKPLIIDFQSAFYGSQWTKCYTGVA